MYVIGLKADESILEVNGLDTESAEYINAVVSKYGGSVDEYSLYFRSSSSTEAQRIRRGDEYDVVWTSNEISSIDFAVEDAKPTLKATAPGSVRADGVTTASITLGLFDASNNIIPIDDAIVIAVAAPTRRTYWRVQFTGGTATVAFSTTEDGEWVLPLAARNGQAIKVGAQVKMIAYREY